LSSAQASPSIPASSIFTKVCISISEVDQLYTHEFYSDIVLHMTDDRLAWVSHIRQRYGVLSDLCKSTEVPEARSSEPSSWIEATVTVLLEESTATATSID